jgi:DNA helicase-2/ATP-dependent DNA helicase PcrA
MQEEFKAGYASLNKEQKEAVDYIDGPLLVIAGPGTGKTQLLSLRVANILNKTDTDPGSVLCLTFTNAASSNMKERLNSLVGSSSRNVSVRTFHSFASELMQLYPDYFWNGARLSVVPDAVQRSIVESLLVELPLDNPLALKFAGVYTSTGDVLSALRLTKEAGLTPDKLKAMIELNQAYIDLIEEDFSEITQARLSLKSLDLLKAKVSELPDQNIDEIVAPLTSLSSVIKSSLEAAIEKDKLSGKTTETGKWKRRWIQTVEGKRGLYSERQRNDWWLNLSDVYDLYRNRLHERGYYDYSDMLVEVISALEQKPDLLALVQERYLYVLIDEFQDTNAAQLRLALLVAASSSSETRPNIMAVGDDDQSIFAFNGAELSNMLSFNRLYAETKTIVLEDNYRSTQDVLNASSSIINQAETRLAVQQNFSKELRAAKETGNGHIKHLVYPTREHQLEFVARHIKNSFDDDPNASIAVLARSHSSLRDIASYLIEEKVPISYEQQNNILELELVKQIILLGQLVTSISSGDQVKVNYCLSLLLSYPAWAVEPKTLWDIASATYVRRGHWLEVLLDHKDENLKQLADWLLYLSQLEKHEALPVVMEHLIGLRQSENFVSPLRNYYLNLMAVESSYLENLSGLSVLNNLVYEFVATAKSMPSLEDFVTFLNINNRVVDNSWYQSSDHAVELLSVHKAKGLEFDTVYIIDAIENEWQPRRSGRKPPANLPLQPYGELFDDYARLAYVSATRSRRNLIVSSFSFDGNNQAVMPSTLFDGLDQQKVDSVSLKDSQKALETKLTWPRLNSSDEQLLMKPRLESYKLSATGLIQFLDVSQGGPLQFLERQLLRLPVITTDYMAYGTAMHAGLQTAQNIVNQDKFNLETVINSFASNLKERYLPLSSLEKYNQHGKNILNRLFNEYDLGLAKGDLSEVVLSEQVIHDARVNGTLDHVHTDGKSLIITDYKTGTPLTSFETRDKTKAIKAWRQRTQLLFYCLLASGNDRFKSAQNISAQIIYVEADSTKQLMLGLVPEKEELDRLASLIEAVWQHIMNLDFVDTSKYPDTIEGIKAFEDDLLK